MQPNDIDQFLSTDFDGFREQVDRDGERADVVLDRPPLNVASMPQREWLRQAFEALDAHDDVRVIVLRAEGEHFSSGGDIKGFLEASPEHVSHLAYNVAAPARCRKPVIAANRGYCFGVGFELSLACDFRIALERSLYALPEQRLGQIPGSGGSARLQKIIGVTRTKHMVMRAKRISGAQALDWGIAVDCVPDTKLESTTDALLDMDKPLVRHAHSECHVLLKALGADTYFSVRGAAQPLTDKTAVLINAWEPHYYDHRRNAPRTLILALYIEQAWLAAVQRSLTLSARPDFFSQPCVELTPEMRRIADALVAEMLSFGSLPKDRVESLLFDMLIRIFERFSEWHHLRRLRPRRVHRLLRFTNPARQRLHIEQHRQ